MTTKIRITDSNKSHKKKSDSSNKKENTTTTKNDFVTEIQAIDSGTTAEIEDNDSMGWRSLPEIPMSSEDSDIHDTDETEWLTIIFINRPIWYQIWNMLNENYPKFSVKLHDCDPIIALFDTEGTCSCILYQLFTKTSDRVDIIRKTLIQLMWQL